MCPPNYGPITNGLVVSFITEDVFSFMVNVVVIMEVERCRCSFASVGLSSTLTF